MCLFLTWESRCAASESFWQLARRLRFFPHVQSSLILPLLFLPKAGIIECCEDRYASFQMHCSNIEREKMSYVGLPRGVVRDMILLPSSTHRKLRVGNSTYRGTQIF